MSRFSAVALACAIPILIGLDPAQAAADEPAPSFTRDIKGLLA